ncbi:hypothetical protein NL108_016170, partial [Boleophthalmus pectinirostris]
NSRANTCQRALTSGDACIYQTQNPCGAASRGSPLALVTLDNLEPIAGPRGGDVSFECLPYQLSMVLSVPTMVTTGNGESGFDSGEGA